MIIYHCPVNNNFIGGIRILYNHVDLLNKNRIDAVIMHNSTDNFRITWFPNNTKVIYEHQYQFKPEDILVVPEVYGGDVFPGIKKITFNQNYYLSNDISEDHKYILAISHQNANLIKQRFQNVSIKVLQWSLPKDIYYYDEKIQKKNIVCFFKRKMVDHINSLISKCNGLGFEFRELKGSDKQIADQMRECKIFLQAGDKEGCPRPPAEAMACGCVVVGYTGGGGEDYMLPEFSYPVETLNLPLFEQTLKRVMQSGDLIEKGKKASEYVLNTYSQEKEEKILIDTWREILCR